MDALVLLVLVGGSMAVAVMGARAMLIAVLHVMAHPPALERMRWGGVAVGMAIVFWYVAPAIAARVPSDIVASVLP